MKKVMIVAGEMSGDHRGAEVIKALLQAYPDTQCYGVGGDAMRAAGVNTLFDISALAVMGFIEPIKHLPRILHVFKSLKKELKDNPPDVIILVDYPGFNLRLAKVAKALHIPVLFYISPQVWAWRQNRVKKIAQVIDHMAVIFPFEKQFYDKHSVPVTYVGHPLTETISQPIDRVDACHQLKLEPSKRYISLLPGSRTSEFAHLWPIMQETAAIILDNDPEVEFLLALSPTITDNIIIDNLPIHIITDNTYAAVAASEFAITASGTATLEIALLARPMIVIYKVNRLTAWLAKRLIKIPYVSLCNIVAGKKIIQELLQNDATPEKIADEAIHLLNDAAYYANIKQELNTVRANLGNQQAAHQVAQIVKNLMNKQATS